MTQKLVVVGIGYVGLPLAMEATEAGLAVTGLDASSRVVEAVNAGRSHVDGISDADLAHMRERGFEASTDGSVIEDADVVVVCVPTPLDENGGPDLAYVESAMETVAAHLRKGQLVALESTTYPGTTEEVVVPILEGSGLKAGADFYVGFSPERVDPGNVTYTTKNTPKIVSGIDEASTERMTAFYSQVVDTVVPATGTREAEAAKLLENTYRHLNIALVNELSRVFHELGIDIWEVIRLAKTKPFGFQAFYPGPGVGGHCIPIDPNYLSFHVNQRLGYPVRMVELAQEVNAAMPAYVASRTQQLLNRDKLAVNGSKVLILGVTYKPNISDMREAPSKPLAEQLLEMGADLQYHDPHVPEWQVGSHTFTSVPDLDAAVKNAAVTILVQNHAEYDLERLSGLTPRFFDTSGAMAKGTSERL